METEMFDETWYRNTLALARRLHAGQADKGGQPYIEHVERVARILVERFPDATPEQVHAALLHDVLEDSVHTSPPRAGRRRAGGGRDRRAADARTGEPFVGRAVMLIVIAAENYAPPARQRNIAPLTEKDPHLVSRGGPDRYAGLRPPASSNGPFGSPGRRTTASPSGPFVCFTPGVT
jgi:hypothetical protein